MKRTKKALSIILAITVILVSLSIPVFADYSNGNGCYLTFSDTTGGDYCHASFQVGKTTSVTAGGGASGGDIYDDYRVEIYSYAYCTDGDFFDYDDGYGWMGNPGYADTYIDIDGHECVSAGASYDFYKNGGGINGAFLNW